MSTRPQSAEVPAQLQHLRRKCWRVVLVLDSVSAPLCARAVATLSDPGRPLVALRTLQQAAAKLRGVRHASHLRAHEAARDAASAVLADADSDDLLLDQIVADLTAHVGGDTATLDWLDPSDIDVPLWAAYVSAVQATHRALWIARQEHAA